MGDRTEGPPMEQIGEMSLEFLVADDDVEPGGTAGTMGLFRRRPGDVEIRSVSVSVDRLQASLVKAAATLASMLDSVAEATNGLKLREAQVKFEVTASGGVRFIGTTEIGGTGAITLIFRE
jgi:hypothetical protein